MHTREVQTRAGVTAAAVFDFDATILAGNSFHMLGLYLAARNLFQLPRFALGSVRRKLRLLESSEFKTIVLRPLAGRSRDQIEEFGDHLYLRRIRRALRPAALHRMEEHRRQGHEIHVLSGAFDFILKPFCREFGIAQYRGTELEYRGAWFSGELANGEFLGEAKVRHLRQSAEARGIDLASSYAYSDHPSDLPMLDVVGNPVFVNLTDRTLANAYPVENW